MLKFAEQICVDESLKKCGEFILAETFSTYSIYFLILIFY